MRQCSITTPAGTTAEAWARAVSGSRARRFSWELRWLGFMVFILLAAPKIRQTIGPAPLYLIDGVIAVLLLATHRRRDISWRLMQPIPQLAVAYLCFVWLGELRGMMAYGTAIESIYMIGRFSLGVAVLFIVPKVVRSEEMVGYVLKTAIAGLLSASVISIMYSLGPTRSLVMNTIFTWKFIAPDSESLVRQTLALGGIDETMRARSLIGAATMTTGFLGTVWPMAFLAIRWPSLKGRWLQAAQVAAMLAPVAILMTYGRTAWLMVAVIGTMIIAFGFAGGRRILLIAVMGAGLVVYHVGWQSDWFMVDRVIKRTQIALSNPYESKSEMERFLSYVEPFYHLAENPSWLFLGAGRAGERLSRRGNMIGRMLYNEGSQATHSGFAIAYYCFGFTGAVAHTLLLLAGFRLILRRLRSQAKKSPLYKTTWQSFLMAWCGLGLWWLSGHAVVGEPHGAILFFFMYGFLLACDRLWMMKRDIP